VEETSVINPKLIDDRMNRIFSGCPFCEENLFEQKNNQEYNNWSLRSII